MKIKRRLSKGDSLSIVNAVGFIAFAVILSFGLNSDDIRHAFDLFIDNAVRIVPVFLVVLGFLMKAMIQYVNKDVGSDKVKQGGGITDDELNKIKQDLKKLKEVADNLEGVKISAADGDKLIADVKKRIVGNTIMLAQDSLKEDISKYKSRINLDKTSDEMVDRLQKEITRLNRRGGVNLVVGTVMAVLGITCMAVIVLNSQPPTNLMPYLLHMIPKVSFVLLVEIFAYFFLKLYKNGFEEVKFFQNEITNIESRVLAIKFIDNEKQPDLMKDIIVNLMSTERNFILEKGQSTVMLEKEKISKDEQNQILNLISSLNKPKG